MSIADKRLGKIGPLTVQHNLPAGARVDITAALLTIFRPEIELALVQRAKEKKQCAALKPATSSPSESK
jgi:hypothetical protein